MKFNKKAVGLIALSSVLISGTLLTNDAFAANATKTLKAVFSNIKLVYNGQTISSTSGQEPFMVDGTTYVPIRMAGEALGKSLSWDGTNKIVTITDVTSSTDKAELDKLNAEVTELNKQLANLKSELSTANSTITSKDSTISSLESQIKSLQSALDNKNDNLSSLEKNLNRDYEDSFDLDASISLSGDKNDITVTIKVDEDEWNYLSSSRQESYLQDIVDDILHEYSKADIEGSVKNKKSSKLTNFSVNSSGTVRLGSNSSSGLSESRMLEKLEDEYSPYRGYPVSIVLSVDDKREEVSLKVYIKKSNWENLSSSNQRNLLGDMIDDLEDNYPDYRIRGYVYDADNRSSSLDKRSS
ncbi:stalk domain-containing protein [Paenibacillus oralis]|nr:stalk domain-containing protein [Paenibacillus oralis]